MDYDEFEIKQRRIQALLETYKLDALLLRRVCSFAWATCGASSYINRAESMGEASLLITTKGRHLITNNIEAPRLAREEGLDQKWEFHVAPWYDGDEQVASLTRGLALGCDGPWEGALDVSPALAQLRSNLTAEEVKRFRALAAACAEAMQAAVLAVQPGQSEYQIAAKLGYEVESRGVQAILNLVATDERVTDFRHPLPTDKRLEHYVMLVLCGRRQGLICSMTRLIHFGRIPPDLRRKMEAVAKVDAAFIDATTPGVRLGEIFQQAVRIYAQQGYPSEWQLHHQGGSTGYLPREVIASPHSTIPVLLDQAFAWNPSISGVKSEDTILVCSETSEILTAIPGWPAIEVDGIQRPAILEIL